jgi:hypothetical protein
MTGKERNRLLAQWASDREEVAWRAYQAVLRQDWQFLSDAGETIRPRKPRGPRECWPLLLRVQAAYKELYEKHGAKVTKKMIRQTVDPGSKIALRHFSRLFQKAGLANLPKGSGGRPRRENRSPKK